MNAFRYEAVTAEGAVSRDELRATDEQQLEQLLDARGLTLVRVLARRTHVKRERRARRVPLRDLAEFARYVSVTARAGLSVVEGIDDFARRTRHRSLRLLLQAVAADVRNGGSLADAFARHREAFDPAFLGMVRAGEATGTLDKALLRTAEQLDFQLGVRSQLRGALVPMAVLLLALVGLVILLITFLLPRLLASMVGTGVELPLPTRILLELSGFLTGHWPALACACAAAAGAFHLALRSTALRFRLAGLALRLPVLGGLLRLSAEARFASSMGSLLAAGTDAVKSLQMAADTCGSEHLRVQLRTASRRIEAGATLSEALSAVPGLHPLLQRMLQLGEKAGILDQTLETAVAFYAAEIPRCVKRTMQIVEPAVLVGAGGTIAFVVLATILPIFSLYDSMG